MKLPAGLTDSVLVRLWHGSETTVAICAEWRIPSHHIYWHWSRLRKAQRLPEHPRGKPGRPDPAAGDVVIADDVYVAEAPGYPGARIDNDLLLDRLIRVHGPDGRPDLATRN